MKAALLRSTSPLDLTVTDIPTPTLRPGEVLVKIAAAPINPSDLIFLRNQYGIKKALPVVPGFEGSGTVVESNAGLYGAWLKGKRVSCRAPESGHGTWAEFMAVPASGVIPLLPSVSLEQGSTLIVNPLTAWALLSEARRRQASGFVQTAASSALGQMMERLGRRWGLRSINIVRRREQVERMKQAGAVHVLDSSQTGFDEQLQILCERHHIRLAFDAVGGDLTARLAQAMPKASEVMVYGALAGEACMISPISLIFEEKSLRGFWLTEWVKPLPLWTKARMLYRVQRLLASDLATPVQARLPLTQIHEALELYKTHRSDGKVLLIP